MQTIADEIKAVPVYALVCLGLAPLVTSMLGPASVYMACSDNEFLESVWIASAAGLVVIILEIGSIILKRLGHRKFKNEESVIVYLK